MSSKSKTEGVTGVTKGVTSTRDPLRQSSLKGVTGGHRTIKVTPVTPESGGSRTRTGEKFRNCLEGVTNPGSEVEHNGQRYTVFSIDPYVTKDGREIELYKLHSSCRSCGATFSVRVAVNARYWNARCPGCIRDGRQA